METWIHLSMGIFVVKLNSKANRYGESFTLMCSSPFLVREQRDQSRFRPQHQED